MVKIGGGGAFEGFYGTYGTLVVKIRGPSPHPFRGPLLKDSRAHTGRLVVKGPLLPLGAQGLGRLVSPFTIVKVSLFPPLIFGKSACDGLSGGRLTLAVRTNI